MKKMKRNVKTCNFTKCKKNMKNPKCQIGFHSKGPQHHEDKKV